ncbi:hypothetical protein LCGC14_1977920 [marine sediment metagenome]|uniref:Carbon storage regulator n=1 Tax=marine sediment metagenome TaxID=412755 RepID=A0A0F9HN42_9ZZZZ
MLVLSRQRDESIMIGDNVVVTIVDIRGDKVRLGIEAPGEIPVIRREVYEANRWIAMNLYQAFCAAQKLTYEGLRETAALKGMLPWFNAHVEETLDTMGDDFWPYGVARNRATLGTFLRYHHEQGLSPRKFEVDEMFAPETLEEFVI